jgi:hypothetical protein
MKHIDIPLWGHSAEDYDVEAHTYKHDGGQKLRVLYLTGPM